MIVDRSLTIKRTSGHSDETTESLLNIFNQLAEGGFLKNNRTFILKELDWSHNDRFIQAICSMKNLERLDLWDCEMTFEDNVTVFRSCSKLMELHIKDYGCKPNVHDDSHPTLREREEREEQINDFNLGIKRLRLRRIKVDIEQLR